MEWAGRVHVHSAYVEVTFGSHADIRHIIVGLYDGLFDDCVMNGNGALRMQWMQ